MGNSQSNISIEALMRHFQEKFGINDYHGSDVIVAATRFVNEKRNDLDGKRLQDIMADNDMIELCIRKLKVGCAPGLDGVMTEHIKYSCGTNIIPIIASVFNICLQFGIVPQFFRNGLLIPIQKKSNSDAAVPSNYRPVTISPTLSKLMEILILHHTHHTFSESQFGFVEARGTQMAITLANDVIKYCTKRGSSVHVCSLDAEWSLRCHSTQYPVSEDSRYNSRPNVEDFN